MRYNIGGRAYMNIYTNACAEATRRGGYCEKIVGGKTGWLAREASCAVRRLSGGVNSHPLSSGERRLRRGDQVGDVYNVRGASTRLPHLLLNRITIIIISTCQTKHATTDDSI